MLQEDIQLKIFDSCMDEYLFTKKHMQAWQSPVNVCQRWRNIVFGSPRRLNLGPAKPPARDRLDVWPDLSLFIQSYGVYRAESVDNLIAVLERSDCA